MRRAIKLHRMTPHDFTAELSAYEARKDELLKLCEGKFAVFNGSEFLGVFDSYNAAYNDAVTKYGNVPFLVKLIEREPSIQRVPALFLGVIHAGI